MNSGKEFALYLLERGYPLIIALATSLVAKVFKINYIDSDGLESALDAVITMSSLIIGFMGTLIPIIIGLKSESEFVRYVFRNDHKNLFFKYIKATISSGIWLIAATVILYFENDIKGVLHKNMFYIWIFLLIYFMLRTYRSMSNTLKLIFDSGKSITNNPDDIVPELTVAEIEYKSSIKNTKEP